MVYESSPLAYMECNFYAVLTFVLCPALWVGIVPMVRRAHKNHLTRLDYALRTVLLQGHFSKCLGALLNLPNWRILRQRACI